MLPAYITSFIILYISSHLMRVLRLLVALVLERPRVSNVGLAHFLGALASAIFPFKSGELVRAALIMKAANNKRVGLSAFLVEKVLDASALLLLLVFSSWKFASPIPIALIVILAMSILVFIIARAIHLGASQSIRREFVTRSTTRRSAWVLWLLNEVDITYQGVHRVVAGRLILMVLLTTTIWGLDFAAFSILTSEPGISAIQEFLNEINSSLSFNKLAYQNSDYLKYGLLIIAVCTSLLLLYKILIRHRSSRPIDMTSRSDSIKEYQPDSET